MGPFVQKFEWHMLYSLVNVMLFSYFSIETSLGVGIERWVGVCICLLDLDLLVDLLSVQTR